MYSSETISSQVTMVLRAATAMSRSWNSSPQMMQVPSGLLNMDERSVDAGNRNGDDLLAGDERIFDLNALEILHLGHALALFLADAPVLHQAAAAKPDDEKLAEAAAKAAKAAKDAADGTAIPETFQDYLKKYVYDCADQDALLNVLGGARLMNLKNEPHLGYSTRH